MMRHSNHNSTYKTTRGRDPAAEEDEGENSEESTGGLPGVPMSLSEMVIGSTDTVRGYEICRDVRSSTWNDRPPLLEQRVVVSGKGGGRGAAAAATAAAARLLLGRAPHRGNHHQQVVKSQPETPELLKTVLRSGIPPALRCAVWLSNVMQSVHPHQPASYWHEYRTLQKAQALHTVYDHYVQTMVGMQENLRPFLKNNDDTLTRQERDAAWQAAWNVMPEPSTMATTTSSAKEFVFYIPDMTPAGRNAVKRVVLALERLLALGESEDSSSGKRRPAQPRFLPALTALLLTAQPESYTFCTIREMAHAADQYFPVTTTEYRAWNRAFADVLHKLHPSTATYLQNLGVLTDVDLNNETNQQPMSGLQPIFVHFFTSILPVEYCQRILDLYTLEGFKVMFRFGVALLVLFRKEVPGPSHTTIRTATDWWNALREWTHSEGRNSSVSATMTASTAAAAPRRRSPTNITSNDSHSSSSRSSYSSTFDFELVVRKAYGVHGHYHSPVRHGDGNGGGGDEDEDGMGSRFQRGRTWRFPRRHILQRIIKMEEERVYEQIQIEDKQEQELEQQRPSSPPALSPTSSAASLLPPPSQPLGLVTAGAGGSERLDGEAMTSVITGRGGSSGSGGGGGGRQSPDTTTHVPPVLAASTAARMQLAEWMPLTLRLTSMQLLYSTHHHGRSLEMLYRRVQHCKHTVLLCEVLQSDVSGETPPQSLVVGMYASQPWHCQNNGSAYGDGSCFLFRLQPQPACWKWKPQLIGSSSSATTTLSPTAAKPTLTTAASEPLPSFLVLEECRSMGSGEESLDHNHSDHHHDDAAAAHDEAVAAAQRMVEENNAMALREQFMVSTRTYMSMGGNPDGSAGLRFNDDLTVGESSPAVGFQNEPLHHVLFPNKDETSTSDGTATATATSTTGNSMFSVGLVEVYGLVRNMDGGPIL